MTQELSREPMAANDPEFKARVVERLTEVQRAVTGLTAELHGIMRLLEPCYGELDGAPCILGWHRGPHQAIDGTEWLDKE